MSHADAGVGKWPGEKCTLYKQDTKNYSVNNICCMFKITTFLWRTLTLHSGHTSLFLETVTIKFWGPRAECRHMGPRKTNIPMLPSIKIVTSCLNLLYREFLKFFKIVTRKFNFPKYRKYKNFFVFYFHFFWTSFWIYLSRNMRKFRFLKIRKACFEKI